MTISSMPAMLGAGDASQVQSGDAPNLMPFGASPAQPAGSETGENVFRSVLDQLIPMANAETASISTKPHGNAVVPPPGSNSRSHLGLPLEDDVRPTTPDPSANAAVVVAPPPAALPLALVANPPAPSLTQPEGPIVVERQSPEPSGPASPQAQPPANDPAALPTLRLPIQRNLIERRTWQSAPASTAENAETSPVGVHADQSGGRREAQPQPAAEVPDVPAAPIRMAPRPERASVRNIQGELAPAVPSETTATAVAPSSDAAPPERNTAESSSGAATPTPERTEAGIAPGPLAVIPDAAPAKRTQLAQSSRRRIEFTEPGPSRTPVPPARRALRSEDNPVVNADTEQTPQLQLAPQPSMPRHTEPSEPVQAPQRVAAHTACPPPQTPAEEEPTSLASTPERPRQTPTAATFQAVTPAITENRLVESEVESQARRRPVTAVLAPAQPAEPERVVTPERPEPEQAPANAGRQHADPAQVIEATCTNAPATPADTQIAFTGRLTERKSAETESPRVATPEPARRPVVESVSPPAAQEAVTDREPRRTAETERPTLHTEQPQTFSAIHREVEASTGPRHTPEADPETRPLRTETIQEPIVRPSSEPVREISMRIGDPAQESAHLRVVERGGEVLVSVRSGSEQLARTLSNDLGELTHRLEQTGFQAELWRPATQSSSGGDLSRDHRESASTAGQNQDQHASPQRRGDAQEQPGQRRREPWEELDESLSFS